MRSRFLGFAQVLIGNPVPTFPGHALAPERRQHVRDRDGLAGSRGSKKRALIRRSRPTTNVAGIGSIQELLP